MKLNLNQPKQVIRILKRIKCALPITLADYYFITNQEIIYDFPNENVKIYGIDKHINN